MSFAPVPAAAAWHHRGARSGFEVVYFQARGDRCGIEGWTTAIEDGATWAVEYAIEVDAAWATRSAAIRGRSAGGSRTALLEADGSGHWLVDGEPAPHLDGCLDVDLEASAVTNALPVRRMGLPVAAAAPAAYVRAVGLAVERLEQTYVRTTDEATCQRYDYTAPAFGFGARLVYDQAGLVLDYPGSPSGLADGPRLPCWRRPRAQRQIRTFYDARSGARSSKYQTMIAESRSSSHRLIRSISNERSTLPGWPTSARPGPPGT